MQQGFQRFVHFLANLLDDFAIYCKNSQLERVIAVRTKQLSAYIPPFELRTDPVEQPVDKPCKFLADSAPITLT